MSDSKLFTALLAAQAEIKQPKKNASNPGFKGSKFANLEACFDAVREPLRKHGLAITQTIDARVGDVPLLVTTLTHVSGEAVSSLAPLMKDATPQQLGSAITYMRRYSLCALLGLVAEDDDDGNAASSPTPASGFVKKDPAHAARESFKVAAEKATTLEQLEKAKAAVASMDGDKTIGEAYAAALARLGKK